MKSGFKQFRLEGIGVNGTAGHTHYGQACDRHPYLKVEFWQNPANQFWNSDIYSEESRIDLAKRANVTYQL